MTVAWIVWRSMSKVRTSWPEYRAKSADWFASSRRLPLEDGKGWYEVHGQELRALDPVNLAHLGSPRRSMKTMTRTAEACVRQDRARGPLATARRRGTGCDRRCRSYGQACTRARSRMAVSDDRCHYRTSGRLPAIPNEHVAGVPRPDVQTEGRIAAVAADRIDRDGQDRLPVDTHPPGPAVRSKPREGYRGGLSRRGARWALCERPAQGGQRKARPERHQSRVTENARTSTHRPLTRQTTPDCAKPFVADVGVLI